MVSVGNIKQEDDIIVEAVEDDLVRCKRLIEAALNECDCLLTAHVVFEGKISYANGNGTIVRAEPKLEKKGG